MLFNCIIDNNEICKNFKKMTIQYYCEKKSNKMISYRFPIQNQNINLPH